ncbi:MAG: hypothetical protein N2507_04205 [Candidatus Bipolaricaulota bacterium]|nr:hypothetical protein [Candidatus Bipolaricaulota bacterium]
MALWVREGRRRWEAVRALPPYSPPAFLRIAPGREGPPWWLSWSVGPDFGADALPELLEALLRATTSLPSPPDLRRVVGAQLEPVEEIPPFAPQAVRQPGLLLQRVQLHPARWLLLLHLARTEGHVLVPAVDRYLVGGWWASLVVLKRACEG